MKIFLLTRSLDVVWMVPPHTCMVGLQVDDKSEASWLRDFSVAMDLPSTEIFTANSADVERGVPFLSAHVHHACWGVHVPENESDECVRLQGPPDSSIFGSTHFQR